MAYFYISSKTLTALKFQIGAFLLLIGMTSAKLSHTFYAKTCPSALSTIKSAVNSAVSSEARMGASLLRLHFHDCFVNGCDASVLLDGTSGEKFAPPNNNSLKGFEVVDSIKSQLESSCPGVVSCADVLAVAARDSVVALGGPPWKVQLGGRDSTTASSDAASANLPSPFADLNDLISNFSRKGFTTTEMVALSGAHTIGLARCIIFRNRTCYEKNINTAFRTSLKRKCPSSGGDDNLAPLDVKSPRTFDNAYFKNLLAQKGPLHSDQQLFSGGSTDALVRAFSSDPKSFAEHFAKAMVKMAKLSLLTGTNGQIRANCRKPN